MAEPERVGPAPQEGESQKTWDFPWGPVPAQLATFGDRRLEARSYLTDGYGLRNRLVASANDVRTIGEVAEVWLPGRLKSYVVPQGKGLPYLSAGQVLEERPRVRKWIARAMVKDPASLEVDPSWLLPTRSGEVGKLTAVYDEHLGKTITDDMLRIVTRDADDYGWLYAYMRTPAFGSIARTAQYGHMIKHLESAHVNSIPIPWPEADVRRKIGNLASQAIELRRRARRDHAAADALYEEAVGALRPTNETVHGTVRASDVAKGRRRLDAQHHRADTEAITQLVHSSATHGVNTLDELSESVTLGNRFKRFFDEGEIGTPYRSAGELFDVNPPVVKRIFSALLDNPERYMLHAGWIIMACSGQTYGLLGRTRLLTTAHEGVFGSHDLIRIVPRSDRIRPGYLQTAISNEQVGRPLVIRNAYGTSIPHLDPVDIRKLPIPRFAKTVEDSIAELAESAISLNTQADELETSATDRAQQVVNEYLENPR
jgi:type I restriction enzyme S subunit